MKLFGFAILRNGVKYDYPFVQSLKSLNGVAEEVYLALGDNEDTTEDVVKDLDFLKVFPTVWDEAIMKAGGVILSQQTNYILNKLRDEKKDVEGAWGLYLQCDEVIQEREYKKILTDIWHAHEHGYDAVSFRYIHFWQSHDQIAINKKWYPQEIRAVKLDSDVESWGDAQSFRNHTKVYQSDAHIFHYGHVREEDKYQVKKKEFLELYHTDDKIAKYRRREKRFDNMTETLTYLGPHPEIMHERIEKIGGTLHHPPKEEVFILGDKDKYSLDLINRINVKKVHWVEERSQLKGVPKDQIVLMELNFWDRIFKRSKVPSAMRSKLAREWDNDYLLVLRLSEKGFSFKY